MSDPGASTTRVSASRKVRGLWLTGGSVLAAVMLAMATQGAISQIAHEQRTERYSFATGDVEQLVVEVDRGWVEVVSVEADEVNVTAEVTDGLWRTGQEARLEDGVLSLTGSCMPLSSFCGVNYRVEIPGEVPVRARSRSGDLRIVDRDAPVDARTRSGNVELRGATGRVEARTRSGNVSAFELRADDVEARATSGNVTVEMAEPPRNVEARTRSGNVTVVVPDDSATYRTDLGTRSGSTEEAVRTDPASQRAISAHATSGNVSIRYP